MNRIIFYSKLDKYKREHQDELSHSDEYGKKHYNKIDNYYGPGWISNYSIGANSITVASGCGYSIAIPVELPVGKYYISSTPSIPGIYYSVDGTYTGTTYSNGSIQSDGFIFPVTSSIKYVVFLFAGGGTCTTEGTQTSKTYTNVHLYKLD